MKATFLPRKEKKDSKGLYPIQLVVNIGGQRIRRNIPKVRVSLKHWKNNRIKPNLKSEIYNFHIEYNKKLDDLENQIKDVFRYILLKNLTPTRELFLAQFDDNSLQNKISPNFSLSFQEFIETSKTTKAPGTIRKYVTTKRFIEDFQKHSNYDIRFETIVIEFYEKLRDYAFEERNTLNNYFGRTISVIKAFMNWSLDRGYHSNTEFRKFKRMQDNIEVIYLTMDELMTLYRKDFRSHRLNHVKDFYCFGCFTGLRFSDIKALRISNVFEDYLKLNIQKTKTIDQMIPLNDYAKDILSKYKDTLYEPLPSISGQKFNLYIKECCKIAKIDTMINTTRYIGQRRIDKVQPKHQLITSHTARKTFVTNSLILGMKEMVVRNITGHKDEASFKRYVEIAEDFKKSEMDNTWNKIAK
ncbi:site-specific integrase [uncultured Dokdonia sp.]|uniref:site-specific integrase n=1 Tax=uncultured Dokdonia sp. TaxID=575653 RepID=UPI0026367A01|nr:site-specific integrase [uncultured Dokdonia sp.]